MVGTASLILVIIVTRDVTRLVKQDINSHNYFCIGTSVLAYSHCHSKGCAAHYLLCLLRPMLLVCPTLIQCQCCRPRAAALQRG
jgi:hypothetical protein